MIIHLLVNSLFHGTLRASNLLTLIQLSLSASLNHRSAVQSPIAVNLQVHPLIHPESIFCLYLGNDVEAFVLINVNSQAYFKLQGTYSWMCGMYVQAKLVQSSQGKVSTSPPPTALCLRAHRCLHHRHSEPGTCPFYTRKSASSGTMLPIGYIGQSDSGE